MPFYAITAEVTITTFVTVEADSAEEAIAIAAELPNGNLCFQCSENEACDARNLDEDERDGLEWGISEIDGIPSNLRAERIE